MQAVTVEKDPDQSIIVCTLHSDWEAAQTPALAEFLYGMLERIKHPAYLIIDLASVTLDIYDVILFANEAARGSNAFAHHPMLRGLLLVSTESVIDLTVEGM